jgi:hypothetical protein
MVNMLRRLRELGNNTPDEILRKNSFDSIIHRKESTL